MEDLEEMRNTTQSLRQQADTLNDEDRKEAEENSKWGPLHLRYVDISVIENGFTVGLCTHWHRARNKKFFFANILDVKTTIAMFLTQIPYNDREAI